MTKYIPYLLTGFAFTAFMSCGPRQVSLGAQKGQKGASDTLSVYARDKELIEHYLVVTDSERIALGLYDLTLKRDIRPDDDEKTTTIGDKEYNISSDNLEKVLQQVGHYKTNMEFDVLGKHLFTIDKEHNICVFLNHVPK
jgi:hypothetical protein